MGAPQHHNERGNRDKDKDNIKNNYTTNKDNTKKKKHTATNTWLQQLQQQQQQEVLFAPSPMQTKITCTALSVAPST